MSDRDVAFMERREHSFIRFMWREKVVLLPLFFDQRMVGGSLFL